MKILEFIKETKKGYYFVFHKDRKSGVQFFVHKEDFKEFGMEGLIEMINLVLSRNK